MNVAFFIYKLEMKACARPRLAVVALSARRRSPRPPFTLRPSQAQACQPRLRFRALWGFASCRLPQALQRGSEEQRSHSYAAFDFQAAAVVG